MPQAPQAPEAPAGRWPDPDAQVSARSPSSSIRRAGRREEAPTRGVGEAARPGRRSRSEPGTGASPAGRPGQPRKKPLYSRLLRLQHISPNVWQRALLGEGALAAGVVLVLADLATAWTILVLPLAVAVVVKAHDLLAGFLQRPVRVKPAKAPKARRTKSAATPEPRPAGRTRRSRRAAGVAAPASDEGAPQEWPADDDEGAPQEWPADDAAPAQEWPADDDEGAPQEWPADDAAPAQEWPADDDDAAPPQGSAPSGRRRRT